MNGFEIHIKDMDTIFERIQAAGERSEGIINDVLHEYGGGKIEEKIMPLIPASGRKWKGKKKEARSAQPFRQEKGNLSVTVKTKYGYHYLYFPDDGSNTIKHRGNQRFMYRGAEQALPEILEQCTAKLTEEIGG